MFGLKELGAPLSNSEYLIRLASISDRERVAELRMSANLNAKTLEREGDWFEAWVGRQSEDERWGCFLVAEFETGIQAYGMVAWWSPSLVAVAPSNAVPEGYILMGVWVEPSYRRCGVASSLTRKRLDWIHERSGEAWYWTDDDNIGSQELHHSLGFSHYSNDFWFPGGDHSKSSLYRLSWPDEPRRIPIKPASATGE